MPAKPEPINLITCRADFEVAQRRPALAELWFYEYAHRLLAEFELLRAAVAGPSPSAGDLVQDRKETEDSQAAGIVNSGAGSLAGAGAILAGDDIGEIEAP
jgi:hypothetical protein